MDQNLPDIARRFQISGEPVEAVRYGNGHINESHAVACEGGGKYLFQKINRLVFKDVPALMENIRRVTAHARQALAGQRDASRRVLEVIPTRDGESFLKTESGDAWRAFRFIEGARGYERTETPGQAFEAARAFGRFQAMLADLPGGRLNETIPDFHNTPKRFAALQRAIAADARGRRHAVQAEIEFFMAREGEVSVLLDLHAAGRLPERVTHNDCKLNNVLLDEATGEGLCVIDLDTVMPGLAAYDFGDMVRTATSAAVEDESDLSKVRFQIEMFEALARGYLEGAAGIPTREEIGQLAFSGKLITLEIGMRFLTDYLEGDVYFRTHREGQNLDRCRTQIELVKQMEAQMDAMRKIVTAAL